MNYHRSTESNLSNINRLNVIASINSYKQYRVNHPGFFSNWLGDTTRGERRADIYTHLLTNECDTPLKKAVILYALFASFDGEKLQQYAYESLGFTNCAEAKKYYGDEIKKLLPVSNKEVLKNLNKNVIGKIVKYANSNKIHTIDECRQLFNDLPEIENESSNKKTLIFHVNHYTDGNGDLGNMIEISTEIIQRLKTLDIAEVEPYFVITSKGNLKELSERLISSVPFEINQENIYLMEHKEVLALTVDYDDRNIFSQFINNNPHLKATYEKADGVYAIATPFPHFKQTLEAKALLKKDVFPIEITEHYAPSYNKVINNAAISNPPDYFVTGITRKQSGLMVSDKEINPVTALLSIEDEKYLKRLGIDKSKLNIETAQDFLNNTLIIPVYFSLEQCKLLPLWIYLITHSDLAKNYKKIIFHTNKIAYNENDFKETEENFKTWDVLLKKSHKYHYTDYELISDHYFANPEDLTRLFQMYSGKGVAIIAGDKTIELAISTGLLPIYLAPHWKGYAMEKLVEFVFENLELRYLSMFASISNSADLANFIKIQCIKERPLLKYGEDNYLMPSSIFSFICSKTIETWNETYRVELLKNTFWNTLDTQIIPLISAQKTKTDEISPNTSFY
jgi:hypothetical protein